MPSFVLFAWTSPGSLVVWASPHHKVEVLLLGKEGKRGRRVLGTHSAVGTGVGTPVLAAKLLQEIDALRQKDDWMEMLTGALVSLSSVALLHDEKISLLFFFVEPKKQELVNVGDREEVELQGAGGDNKEDAKETDKYQTLANMNKCAADIAYSAVRKGVIFKITMVMHAMFRSEE